MTYDQGQGQDIRAGPERCDSNEIGNGSDICAQWAAARAAGDSARIAGDAMRWNVFAFVALLLTLVATGWAAFAAERSVKVAERTAKQQLRAYMSLLRFSMALTTDAKGNLIEGEIVTQWRNAGQTPANRCENSVNWQSFNGKMPDDFEFPAFANSAAFGTPAIGPGSMLRSGSRAVTPGDIAVIISTSKRMYAWASVDYVDVFGANRRTEGAVEVEIETSTSGSYLFAFKVLRKHNGMDEFCMRPPTQQG